MGEEVKRFFVFVLFVLVIIGFFLAASIAGNNVETNSEFEKENSREDIFTGFVVHPLFSGFSAPENGFVVNGNSLSVTDNAVYKMGYYSINGGSWTNFSLTGAKYGASTVWLTGKSTYTLPQFGVGEHYVIVYSCKYISTSASWDCYGGRWQLLVINNTPVIIVPPAATCSDGIKNQDETGIDCGGKCGACSTGRTFYVSSSSGNDANTGTSSSSPWKTISKVNAQTFNPGDYILFEKNGIWRESLTMRSSGKSNQYIYFASYGTGNKPKILGSTEIKTWTSDGGNIWYSTNSVNDPYAVTQWHGNIYFKEKNGDVSWGRVKKSSKTNLVTEYDWTWSSNKIYIYSPTDPNTRYLGVEAAQRETAVQLNDQQYLSFDGFELAYTADSGIKEKYPTTNIYGLIVKNMHIHHIGIKYSSSAYGLSIWHSDMLIQNNTVHDCGRRSISLNTYEGTATVGNIIVENNVLYHGFHTTGVDIASSGGCNMKNIIVRNNLIYDDTTETLDGVESHPSTGIYVADAGSGWISNISIYNNLLKGISMDNILQSTIYHNTFYGMNPNTPYVAAFLFIQGTSSVIVKDNIFYGNVDHTLNNKFYCMYIGSTVDAQIDYNLYWQTDSLSTIINWHGTIYKSSDWTKYKGASGQDSHSPNPANPNFISSSDVHLQTGSPAIGKGIAISELTKDYDGVAYKNPPSIGAYEK